MDRKCLMIFAILHSNVPLSLPKSTVGIPFCYVSQAPQKHGCEFQEYGFDSQNFHLKGESYGLKEHQRYHPTVSLH